jgi:hypothetical protein
MASRHYPSRVLKAPLITERAFPKAADGRVTNSETAGRT